MENMDLIWSNHIPINKSEVFLPCSTKEEKLIHLCGLYTGGASMSPSEFPPGARWVAQWAHAFCFAPRCRDVPFTRFGGKMVGLRYEES